MCQILWSRHLDDQSAGWSQILIMIFILNMTSFPSFHHDGVFYFLSIIALRKLVCGSDLGLYWFLAINVCDVYLLVARLWSSRNYKHRISSLLFVVQGLLLIH